MIRLSQPQHAEREQRRPIALACGRVIPAASLALVGHARLTAHQQRAQRGHGLRVTAVCCTPQPIDRHKRVLAHTRARQIAEAHLVLVAGAMGHLRRGEHALQFSRRLERRHVRCCPHGALPNKQKG